MEWSEVLDPGLEPEEIICERVPALHESRRQQFQSYSATSVIVSLYFKDSGERFTLQVGPERVEVERGEMIDFPQATIIGERARWRQAIELASRLVEPADKQIERYEGRVQLTERIKADFERFDGVIDITISGLPAGADLRFQVVLNDYEAPPRAKTAEITVEWPLLVKLAHGEIRPVEAARQIVPRGAMGLAFELGGFLAQEFDL